MSKVPGQRKTGFDIIGSLSDYCTSCGSIARHCKECDMAPCKHGNFGLFSHLSNCPGPVMHFLKEENINSRDLPLIKEMNRPIQKKDLREIHDALANICGKLDHLLTRQK